MSGAAVAAQVGIAMLAAGMEAKNNYEADAANIKLQSMQMHIETARNVESFMSQQAQLSQQAFMSSAQVEKARSAAQSNFEASMAGSGIGGQSVSELSADITRAAAEDQQAIKLQTAQASDANKQALRQGAENNAISAGQLKINNYHSQILSAGLKQFGQSADKLFTKK